MKGNNKKREAKPITETQRKKRNRKYQQKHQNKHNFLSKQVSFKADQKGKKLKHIYLRLLKQLLVHIKDSCFEDCLKYPRGSPKPKSSLLSPFSFDIYFGEDVPGSKQVDANGNMVSVERFAYATGSGGNTIGFDPKTAKIHEMPTKIWMELNWSVSKS